MNVRNRKNENGYIGYKKPIQGFFPPFSHCCSLMSCWRGIALCVVLWPIAGVIYWFGNKKRKENAISSSFLTRFLWNVSTVYRVIRSIWVPLESTSCTSRGMLPIACVAQLKQGSNARITASTLFSIPSSSFRAFTYF